MSKIIKGMRARLWIGVGILSIGVVVAMAAAQFSSKEPALAGVTGTIAPAERVQAPQPTAADVKLDAPASTSEGLMSAAHQAANGEADQAAALGPGGCTRMACAAQVQGAAAQAANQSASQAAALGPGGCTKTTCAAQVQGAAAQAANQASSEASTQSSAK
jgi:hypothetical protein